MNQPFTSNTSRGTSLGTRFVTEFVEQWNKLCEGRPWVPPMDKPEFPEDRLASLIEHFEKLANLPMPDPRNPTPVYVSRMHFQEWADELKQVMAMLGQYQPIPDENAVEPEKEPDYVTATTLVS